MAEVGHQLFFEALFNVLGNNDKNPTDDYGTTTLHYATMNDYWDNCGRTPLHFAAMHGHLPLCQYIMKQVTDKNPGNNDKGHHSTMLQ